MNLENLDAQERLTWTVTLDGDREGELVDGRRPPGVGGDRPAICSRCGGRRLHRHQRSVQVVAQARHDGQTASALLEVQLPPVFAETLPDDQFLRQPDRHHPGAGRYVIASGGCGPPLSAAPAEQVRVQVDPSPRTGCGCRPATRRCRAARPVTAVDPTAGSAAAGWWWRSKTPACPAGAAFPRFELRQGG